jgi:hypothetical protein
VFFPDVGVRNHFPAFISIAIILNIRITTASEDRAMNNPDSLGYRIKE